MKTINIDTARSLLSLVREARAALPIPNDWKKMLPWVAQTTTAWPVMAGAYAAGVATGAGAALLFAPMKGSELRAKLQEQVSGFATKLQDDVSNAATKVSKETKEIAHTVEVEMKQATGSHRSSNGTDPSLDDLTREELYTLAQERDLAGRSGMAKEELLEALRKRN